MRWYRRANPALASALLVSAALGGAVFGAGCVGNIGDGDATDQGKSPLCKATPQPGEAPLRRLTRYEYDNTLRDLLGDVTAPGESFPPDQKIGAFSNTATALTVPPLLAQGYESAAEELAKTAIANPSKLLPCDPVAAGEDACAQQFIATFGKKAFRRPLTDDEKAGLFALYQTNRAGADFTNGIQAVLEAFLQSAPFLYRAEDGVVSKINAGVVPLSSYEMASRLSYFIWGSMPDDTLFAAADSDALTTPEQIATQARRMLQDPKAKPAVEEFYSEWLEVATLGGVAKDAATYPDFTPSLRSSMQAETKAFVDWVMFDGDGRLETMLTAPVSFLNAELAHAYGISGITGTALQMVQLDPKTRAGVLTQPSILATLGKPDRSSPVLRGRFIREQLFCQTIPNPPPALVIVPPKVTPGVSTRESFSAHSSDPACSGCHSLMDPIGFGFESYDGMGEYRTVDQGRPVDSSGKLDVTDIDGTFDGAVDLAGKLTQSQEVRDCVVTQWFRFAFGRGETPEDACSLDTTKRVFSSSNHDMRELMVALTQTDAFRYRPAQVQP